MWRGIVEFVAFHATQAHDEAVTTDEQLNPTSTYERNIREALAMPGLSPETSMRTKRYIRIVAARTGRTATQVMEALR